MKNIAFCAAVLSSTLLPGCGQRHLPAGSENGMAAALIRHELAAAPSHIGAHVSPCPCYVLVGGRDLAREQLAALSREGPSFVAGSAWAEGRGVRIRVGLPQHRWNGNFDVAYAMDCTPACAASGTAVMRYDGSRWRVLSSHLD